MIEDELYNFILILGVKFFNIVCFYLDMVVWKKIDLKEEYEKYYNWYVYIRVFIVKEDIKFILDCLDMFLVMLNFEDVEKLGINYVISK